MFTNVLVGIDGKGGGRDSIALATHLADPSAKLTLVHVHAGRLRPVRAVSPPLIREEREASHALLEHERATVGVEADLLSVEALSPGRGLHEQADRLNADLLVVGSCSHGVLGRAMLGDDTRASLNGAPCPVAIAATGYAEHPTAFSKIGVAYDGSPESRAALDAADRLVRTNGGQVYARQVVSIPAYAYSAAIATGDVLDEMIEQAQTELEKLPDVKGKVVGGIPGEELVAFGDEVDLLVTGSRGYGPLKRVMLGSTSDYLQRHAHCSLLVLPRPGIADEGVASGDDEHAETPMRGAA